MIGSRHKWLPGQPPGRSKPGKSERQKKELADRISKDVCQALGYGEESVSASFEEVSSNEWAEKVYRLDIAGKPEQLYKKPGYSM